MHRICDWDSTLTGSDLEEWNSIQRELNELSELKVPRYYSVLSPAQFCIQLHGFSDALASAYAAVVYVHTITIQGEVSVQLLASKTKVAPIKKQSIPRLELMAALLLSKLVWTIITVLPSEVVAYYWTDSMSILYWIQNNKTWKQYVDTRIKEIR